MPILMRTRAMPMVRTIWPMRCFCLQRRVRLLSGWLFASHWLGHGAAVWLTLVNVNFEHTSLEKGLRLYRPRCPTRCCSADQVRQPGTVMGVGGAGLPGADQPVSPVDTYVVFVTEHRDGEINRLEGPRIGTSFTLALLYFTLQRASRSFLQSRAGFAFHVSGCGPP